MPRPTARFPSVDALAAALADVPIPSAAAVDAAVMICLRAADEDGAAGNLELLLCRRASREGDPWSGQMGLPGGRRDPGDIDALAVAVRETVEEVGFDPLAQGRLVGALPVLRGRGRRVPVVRVAPFVTVVRPDIVLRLSEELAAAWWVPLEGLRPARVSVPELPVAVPAYLAPVDAPEPAVVWGMTHRMLTMLRAAARRRPEVTAAGEAPSP